MSDKDRATAILRLLDFFPAELEKLADLRGVDLEAVCFEANSLTKLRFVQDFIMGKISPKRLEAIDRFVALMSDVHAVHRADVKKSGLSGSEIREFGEILELLVTWSSERCE